MNADYYIRKIIEYSSTINNCCAYVGECIYTGKCAIDDDIVGCSDRDVFKKVKEALELRESLIRCKDCRYFERRVRHYGSCDIHCNGIGERKGTSEGYFCSWAERKEE